jgi:thiol-disulfide isomerase/thioredoxin
MKKIFFLLSGILLIAACNKEKESALSVLEKVKKNYDSHSSLSYKILYRQKYFSGNDTAVVRASCKLLRVPSDTLFEGRIWFSTEDSVEKYYDLKTIFVAEHSNKKITTYKAHDQQDFAITGNTTGSVIRVNFTNTEHMISDVKDSLNSVRLFPDSIPDHFIVSVNYPDEDSFSHMEKNIWIRKDDFVIDKMTYTVQYQGEWQYNEWNLSDLRFDDVNAEELDNSMKALLADYQITEYQAPSEKDFALLENGSVAPAFSGINFESGKPVSLFNYQNKIVILDFSYMSCMPCIKAIPHLTEISKQFGDKVVVLAMNSKDGDENGKQRLPDFITKNKMNYPVILTDKKTDSLYNVKAYPTLYLLDRKGKILFSQIGFTENIGDTLKTMIRAQLK